MTKPYWSSTIVDPVTERPVESGHGCQHDECFNPATAQWQRAATPEETHAFIHGVGQGKDTTVTVAVFSCNEHAAPLEQAAIVHVSDCPAPGGCDCA